MISHIRRIHSQLCCMRNSQTTRIVLSGSLGVVCARVAMPAAGLNPVHTEGCGRWSRGKVEGVQRSRPDVLFYSRAQSQSIRMR